MKILFYFEHGEKQEIGTGHLYRTKAIANALKRRGHNTEMMSGDLPSGYDVLVIDHIHSQQDLINRAKSAKMKIVLIDGAEEDAELVDISVSAFYNKKAKYRGINYISFPIGMSWDKYRPDSKSKTVFVSMGGFDANNHAEMVINVLKNMGLNAVVTKSINHPNFKEKYSNVEIFEEEDYYLAMKECIIGIVNGGLTLFQCLHYGLPCIAIPQYEHQKYNIGQVSHCCSQVELNEEDIRLKIDWFMKSEYYRESISKLAQHWVDGKGVARICNLIEGLRE